MVVNVGTEVVGRTENVAGTAAVGHIEVAGNRRSLLEVDVDSQLERLAAVADNHNRSWVDKPSPTWKGRDREQQSIQFK